MLIYILYFYSSSVTKLEVKTNKISNGPNYERKIRELRNIVTFEIINYMNINYII